MDDTIRKALSEIAERKRQLTEEIRILSQAEEALVQVAKQAKAPPQTPLLSVSDCIRDTLRDLGPIGIRRYHKACAGELPAPSQREHDTQFTQRVGGAGAGCEAGQ